MSRTSPGRYALHEFSKNVYDVVVTDGAGRALTASRPNLHQWDVAGHDGVVRVRYRVFGDRIDGTYLERRRDPCAHQHAGRADVGARPRSPAGARDLRASRGHVLERRHAVVPDGRTRWSSRRPTCSTCSTAHPSSGPACSRRLRRRWPPATRRPAPTIRVALHHTGAAADVAPFVDGVRRIVEQARRVFGEYPAFENNTYTFLADYLPWASGDGMEHRNSTVLTSRGSLADSRIDLLGTVSHEFIHAWNVERIRPRTLEPFNFEDANVSGELWLAEGVTSYYDDLLMARAGLIELPALLSDLTAVVSQVMLSPATRFRSAEDMSRMAPFVDAASWIDRTNWPNTFISYYVYGAALGLGLDFSIREKTGNARSLDDVMRALWKAHGKVGGREVGYVDAPYTAADVRTRDRRGDRRRGVCRRPDAALRPGPRGDGLQAAGHPGRSGAAQPLPRTCVAGTAADRPVRRGACASRVRPASGLPPITPASTSTTSSRRWRRTDVGTVEQLDAALKKFKPGDRVTMTFLRRGQPVKADVVARRGPAHRHRHGGVDRRDADRRPRRPFGRAGWRRNRLKPRNSDPPQSRRRDGTRHDAFRKATRVPVCAGSLAPVARQCRMLPLPASV